MVRTTVPSRAQLRRRVDAELDAFLADQRRGLPPEARPLLDELEAIVRAGGKRLRPMLACLGHVAGGGTLGEPILRVAAALELLHTFALVQDDVMDRTRLRRGRVSSHVALAELARSPSHRGDADHFGVSAALLAADLAVVCADRLMDGSGFPPETLRRARVRYDEMRVRSIAGQYLDLLSAHRGEADVDTARRIGRLKTAGYSIADPLAIGALLADADPVLVGALDAFGFPLGEAFQVADDLRGVFGSNEADPAEDLREGKQTVLLAEARRLAGPADRAFLDERVGDPGITADDVARLRTILRDSGALDAGRRLLAELTEEAKAALDRVPAPVADALGALADEIVARA